MSAAARFRSMELGAVGCAWEPPSVMVSRRIRRTKFVREIAIIPIRPLHAAASVLKKNRQRKVHYDARIRAGKISDLDETA